MPRHQTLRATIDWSHDLLVGPEQILFRRLAVFAGGFTLEAIESMRSSDLKRNEILDLLGRLVDKSLVIVEHTSTIGETRYRLLETIRQYALERLVKEKEEGDDMRHLKFFMSFVEKIEPELERIHQQVWLDQLELEIDNLRVGLDWGLKNQEIVNALRLVSALRRFWFIRNHHSEGVERLKAILERSDATEPTLARLKALNTYLFMLWPSGQLAEVLPIGEDALALAKKLDDRWHIAFALLWLGVGVTSQANYQLASFYLEQSLEMWRELQDVAYLGWSLASLGEVALMQSDYARAQTLYEQAVPLLGEAKDYSFLAIPLRRLGQLAMFQGDLSKRQASLRKVSSITGDS